MWHDPDDRIQRAIIRFEEDDVRTARRMLRQLERQGVQSPRIELYLGHCHLEEGNPEAALRRYRRACGLAPRRAEPWIGMGLAYGRIGRLRRARSAFRRASRLDPNLEEAHCQLVHCHVLLGELDAALRVSRRVEALDPRCPHVHRHIAIGHALAGRHDESLAAWRRVGERDPDHPELHVGIGRELASLRRTVEARAAFHRALARNPGDAEARVGLGDLCLAERRDDEAIEHFKSAVASDPEDLVARTRWAETLLVVGRPLDALEALAPVRNAGADARFIERAIDLSPPADDSMGFADVVDVTLLEAHALAALGRRAAGLALVRSLVLRAGADEATACALRALGDYLLAAGRPRTAARVLSRVIAVDRADSADSSSGSSDTTFASLRLLARAVARAGRRKRACSLLARASRARPHDEGLHLDVAASLVARGRLEGAERSLLRALSWLPESASIWAAAAESALRLGRPGDARSRVRSALRRDRRHPEALSTLVELLVLREDWRRAANAARAARRVLPPSDVAVRSHGLALLRLGRAKEAALSLRRYVLAAPADSMGYRLLAEALERSGEATAADAQRRIAQAIGAA